MTRYNGKITILKPGEPNGNQINWCSKTLTIGSDETCDGCIYSDLIDTNHCVLSIKEENKAYITHIGSKNFKTLVDGNEITQSCFLKHNSVFTVGNVSFRFEYPKNSKWILDQQPVLQSTANPTLPFSPRTPNSRLKQVIKPPFVSTPKPIMYTIESHKKHASPVVSPIMLSNTKISTVVSGRRLNVRPYITPTQNKLISKPTRKSRLLNLQLIKNDESRRHVSFGPNLSPEQFDKELPPIQPLKKGATPMKTGPSDDDDEDESSNSSSTDDQNNAEPGFHIDQISSRYSSRKHSGSIPTRYSMISSDSSISDRVQYSTNASGLTGASGDHLDSFTNKSMIGPHQRMSNRLSGLSPIEYNASVRRHSSQLLHQQPMATVPLVDSSAEALENPVDQYEYSSENERRLSFRDTDSDMNKSSSLPKRGRPSRKVEQLIINRYSLLPLTDVSGSGATNKSRESIVSRNTSLNQDHCTSATENDFLYYRVSVGSKESKGLSNKKDSIDDFQLSLTSFPQIRNNTPSPRVVHTTLDDETKGETVNESKYIDVSVRKRGRKSNKSRLSISSAIEGDISIVNSNASTKLIVDNSLTQGGNKKKIVTNSESIIDNGNESHFSCKKRGRKSRKSIDLEGISQLFQSDVTSDGIFQNSILNDKRSQIRPHKKKQRKSVLVMKPIGPEEMQFVLQSDDDSSREDSSSYYEEFESSERNKSTSTRKTMLFGLTSAQDTTGRQTSIDKKHSRKSRQSCNAQDSLIIQPSNSVLLEPTEVKSLVKKRGRKSRKSLSVGADSLGQLFHNSLMRDSVRDEDMENSRKSSMCTNSRQSISGNISNSRKSVNIEEAVTGEKQVVVESVKKRGRKSRKSLSVGADSIDQLFHSSTMSDSVRDDNLENSRKSSMSKNSRQSISENISNSRKSVSIEEAVTGEQQVMIESAKKRGRESSLGSQEKDAIIAEDTDPELFENNESLVINESGKKRGRKSFKSISLRKSVSAESVANEDQLVPSVSNKSRLSSKSMNSRKSIISHENSRKSTGNQTKSADVAEITDHELFKNDESIIINESSKKKRGRKSTKSVMNGRSVGAKEILNSLNEFSSVSDLWADSEQLKTMEPSRSPNLRKSIISSTPYSTKSRKSNEDSKNSTDIQENSTRKSMNSISSRKSISAEEKSRLFSVSDQLESSASNSKRSKKSKLISPEIGEFSRNKSMSELKNDVQDALRLKEKESLMEIVNNDSISQLPFDFSEHENLSNVRFKLTNSVIRRTKSLIPKIGFGELRENSSNDLLYRPNRKSRKQIPIQRKSMFNRISKSFEADLSQNVIFEDIQPNELYGNQILSAEPITAPRRSLDRMIEVNSETTGDDKSIEAVDTPKTGQKFPRTSMLNKLAVRNSLSMELNRNVDKNTFKSSSGEEIATQLLESNNEGRYSVSSQNSMLKRCQDMMNISSDDQETIKNAKSIRNSMGLAYDDIDTEAFAFLGKSYNYESIASAHNLLNIDQAKDVPVDKEQLNNIHPKNTNKRNMNKLEDSLILIEPKAKRALRMKSPANTEHRNSKSSSNQNFINKVDIDGILDKELTEIIDTKNQMICEENKQGKLVRGRNSRKLKNFQKLSSDINILQENNEQIISTNSATPNKNIRLLKVVDYSDSEIENTPMKVNQASLVTVDTDPKSSETKDHYESKNIFKEPLTMPINRRGRKQKALIDISDNYSESTSTTYRSNVEIEDSDNSKVQEVNNETDSVNEVQQSTDKDFKQPRPVRQRRKLPQVTTQIENSVQKEINISSINEQTVPTRSTRGRKKADAIITEFVNDKESLKRNNQRKKLPVFEENNTDVISITSSVRSTRSRKAPIIEVIPIGNPNKEVEDKFIISEDEIVQKTQSNTKDDFIKPKNTRRKKVPVTVNDKLEEDVMVSTGIISDHEKPKMTRGRNNKAQPVQENIAEDDSSLVSNSVIGDLEKPKNTRGMRKKQERINAYAIKDDTSIASSNVATDLEKPKNNRRKKKEVPLQANVVEDDISQTLGSVEDPIKTTSTKEEIVIPKITRGRRKNPVPQPVKNSSSEFVPIIEYISEKELEPVEELKKQRGRRKVPAKTVNAETDVASSLNPADNIEQVKSTRSRRRGPVVDYEEIDEEIVIFPKTSTRGRRKLPKDEIENNTSVQFSKTRKLFNQGNQENQFDVEIEMEDSPKEHRKVIAKKRTKANVKVESDESEEIPIKAPKRKIAKVVQQSPVQTRTRRGRKA